MAKASREQRKPRSSDFWRNHVDGWRASKLTQAEYCVSAFFQAALIVNT